MREIERMPGKDWSETWAKSNVNVRNVNKENTLHSCNLIILPVNTLIMNSLLFVAHLSLFLTVIYSSWEWGRESRKGRFCIKRNQPTNNQWWQKPTPQNKTQVNQASPRINFIFRKRNCYCFDFCVKVLFDHGG